MEVSCYSNNSLELNILRAWNMKITDGHNISYNKRLEVKWQTPPYGWLKITFDGVAKGNPGPSSYGAILRDDRGICKGMIAFPIGIQTNHKVEAMAALQGIILAKKWNCTHLWIEGDSNNIIKSLNGTSKPSWSIHSIIFFAIDIIKTFKNCHISHIYREANCSADWAANVVVKNETITTWTGESGLLRDVRQIIINERYRITPNNLD